MDHLQSPWKFGPEFLTYVLWAITPEGRAMNLGELSLEGDHSNLLSTSDLQAFGLIVTAEPYFDVTQPSEVVVMENIVRHDTTGTIEEMDAKYELLKQGQYTVSIAAADLEYRDRRVPLQLQEARNAVAITRATGAERYAADPLAKAMVDLTNAEGFFRGKNDKKQMETNAREATQMAEDARIIIIKKLQDEERANERAATAQREAQANAAVRKAEQEAQLRAQAEADARRLAQQRQQAVQARLEAEQVAQRAAQDKADARSHARRPCSNSNKLGPKPSARSSMLSRPMPHGSELNPKEKSVRSYLVAQGVPADTVTARGLGKNDPVAENSTAVGRQRNRRVEMVVFGEIIGTPIGPARSERIPLTVSPTDH